MKVEKLVYDVREALKEYTDDSELDDRRIMYLYDIKRSKYLRQSLNNTMRPVDMSIKQSLCLDLELVDALECNLDIGCEKILRTKKPIPTPLQLHDRSAITSIRPVNRLSKSFIFTSRERASNYLDAPYPNSIYCFLHTDGHLYFVSQSASLSLLMIATLEGVFEHPLDLINYSDACKDGKPAFDLLTSHYPIQPHYIDIIRNEIVQELANLKQIPEDKINNSTDD